MKQETYSSYRVIVEGKELSIITKTGESYTGDDVLQHVQSLKRRGIIDFENGNPILRVAPSEAFWMATSLESGLLTPFVLFVHLRWAFEQGGLLVAFERVHRAIDSTLARLSGHPEAVEESERETERTEIHCWIQQLEEVGLLT